MNGKEKEKRQNNWEPEGAAAFSIYAARSRKMADGGPDDDSEQASGAPTHEIGRARKNGDGCCELADKNIGGRPGLDIVGDCDRITSGEPRGTQGSSSWRSVHKYPRLIFQHGLRTSSRIAAWKCPKIIKTWATPTVPCMPTLMIWRSFYY